MKDQNRSGWPSRNDVGMRHRLHILGSNPTDLKCGAYLICGSCGWVCISGFTLFYIYIFSEFFVNLDD